MHDATAPSSSILETVDTFITAVPWDDWRQVLVFHREHGGRRYVRIRTWNLHRARRIWYPSQRFFVIPSSNAGTFGAAVSAASRGVPLESPPTWYRAFERQYSQYKPGA